MTNQPLSQLLSDAPGLVTALSVREIVDPAVIVAVIVAGGIFNTLIIGPSLPQIGSKCSLTRSEYLPDYLR